MLIRQRPMADMVMTRPRRLSILLSWSWLRILARFFYPFVFRGGFLDGVGSLEFALMFTWYEARIYVPAKAGIQAG